MTKFVRMAALAAAATIVATPAVAVPVTGPNIPVTATARIVKPLVLEEVSDMDFGSITVQDAGTVTLDGVTGDITCTANLSCDLTGTPAEYKVKGTNNQIVQITKPDVTLTNAVSGTSLNLVLSGPTSFQIPNAGATGGNFKLGGQIAIAADTAEGTYVGDLNVTVQY